MEIDLEEETLYFLEHHGVKGMRWGVITKHKERKVVKARRKEIHREENKKADQKTKKETAGLRAQAQALLDKYNFDGDDGGGGRTQADRKAGREYIKIWDKIYQIENRNQIEAGQIASKKLLDEFGEKKLKDLRVRHGDSFW